MPILSSPEELASLPGERDPQVGEGGQGVGREGGMTRRQARAPDREGARRLQLRAHASLDDAAARSASQSSR